MPNNFSGQPAGFAAKLAVVRDGDLYSGAPTVLASGNSATLTLASTTVTLTNGSGFTSGMNGDKIYISNAATPGNDGWFTLTYISATSVSWTNASGATDANNGSIGFQVAALGVSTKSTQPSNASAFAGAPVRSGVGLWSITTRDNVAKLMDFEVKAVLPSGEYLSTQINTPTLVAGTGQMKLSWTFNVAGTPTDLPYPGSMILFLEYSEMREGMF